MANLNQDSVMDGLYAARPGEKFAALYV